MKHEEIVSKLSLTFPSEPIYEITMRTVISAIIWGLEDKSFDLSSENLE